MEQELVKHLDNLVGFIQTASPAVWSALIKQQYLYGVGGIVLFLVVLITFAYLLHILPKGCTDTDNAELIIFGVLLCVMVGVLILDIIPRLINPLYYATKTLVGHK